MLLETLRALAITSAGGLGVWSAAAHLYNHPELKKELCLTVGINHCDLDADLQRQILEFCHDEIIHSLFEGKKTCHLSFEQLGLYDLFECGYKQEIVKLFSSIESNMFRKAHIYSDRICFFISDELLEAVRGQQPKQRPARKKLRLVA